MSSQRSLQEIIDTISSLTGLEEEKISELISKKMEELGEFVTELGAAHIVVREIEREMIGGLSSNSLNQREIKIIQEIKATEDSGQINSLYPLIKSLKDISENVRDVATRRIVMLGDEIVTPLVELLPKEDIDVKPYIINALG